MGHRALLLEAHHTTHIEGTELTIEQAEKLWAGEDAGARPDDARELLNYRGAFDLVSENLDSGEPITEGLIRHIHQRLVEGVRGGQGQPGRYRAVQNQIADAAEVCDRGGRLRYHGPQPQLPVGRGSQRAVGCDFKL